MRNITFIDADRGWCVGDGGVILRSDDSGLNWQPLDSGTTANLSAIGMFNSKRGVAVGGMYEPHTQLGRGTVVLTDDGGESWKSATSLALPPLRQLILGPRGQCVAAGDWSTLHRSNLFVSFDGGQSWEAIDNGGPAGAVVAVAGSVDDFLALSEQGELTRIRSNDQPQQIMPPGSRWTTLVGEGDLRWLSGPQAAMLSDDRGATWQVASFANGPAAKQTAEAEAIDGHASAACIRDAEVWAIDAAGTTISRHHAGQHPQSHPRTTDASLRAIFRLDQDRGWAVGDWGTILLTRDGGQSWRTVRGADRRAAVLTVASHGHQLPWSLLAIESLQHLRRVAVVTGGGHITSLSESLRIREAAKLLGPSAQHTWDGSSIEARKLIEAAPPAVLVLDHELTAEEKSLWTSIAIEAGVRRVLETERANGQTIHYAAPLPGAGKLAGDVWTDALWLLQPGTLPPEKLQLGARFDRVSDQLAADGLASCVGNDRRYVRQAQSGTSRRHLQVLQARSGESAWIESLINSPAPVSELITQFEATVPRVAKENRQRLLFKIITAAKLRGRPELYQAMLRQAAQLWPDEPLGRLCELHVAAIGSSEEWQRMLGAESLAVASRSRAQAAASHSVQWSPFESIIPAAASSATAIAESANGDAPRPDATPIAAGVQLAGGTEEIAPAPAAQAGFQAHASFAEQASATGTPESPSRAAGRSQKQSPNDPVWQSHPAVRMASRSGGAPAAANEQPTPAAVAATGTWAESSQTTVTPAVLRAAWAARRPLLDGQLSESVWTAGQSFPLASGKLTSGEAAQLHIAYDADFVYLAVQGPLLQSEDGQETTRRRDTPLDHVDRYVIRIDVDGDLLTAYELEFDAEGNTRDTCDGFTHWQPRWFLAVAGDSQRTIAEIAIHRSDLIGPLQQPDRPWNISLQLRDAGQPLPALAMSRPEHWRRLIFD